MSRTHHCNQLHKSDVGKTVTLAGWVHVLRDHGGVIFIDLRDREGLTQVVFRPEENAEVAKEAHTLRSEDVIEISGRVAPRVPDTENQKLATRDIEVIPSELHILNRADDLPFPIDAEVHNEDLRMMYRYYDLRRPQLARNLQVRHRIAKATRDYLDSQGYVEVETPILSKSTPEGARDFLVPSRLMPVKFYALPQAPQQYKQLLMVAGVEKYFQIAKCFRDEDLRADRQPEFTQIDIEASFVTPDDIFSVTEGMLAAIFKAARNVDIKTPFDRLSYREALDRYGSDKPDRRFKMELVDFGENFKTAFTKGFTKIDQLHFEPAIGFIAAVAIERFAITKPVEWRINVNVACGLEDRSEHSFGDAEDVVGRDERRFDVDLRKLRLPVGAQIFVAKTFCDLKIFFNARDHEQLFVLLRRLRQRVKSSRRDSARHQKVTRAFRRTLGQNRRFNFHEPLAVEIIARCLRYPMAHPQVARETWPAQIEVPVRHP